TITTEATGPGGAIVTFTATASDDIAVATFACTPPSGSLFPITDTTVSCTATDTAGNSTTQTFHVIVRDTTAPTISGTPADITGVEATSGSGAAVTYTSPTANDVVDGAVSVSCVPASGSTFALGSTLVTCTATDAHGNSSTTTFHVGVVDTTAPM